VAIAQAHWLNAMLAAWRLGDHDQVRQIAHDWQAGSSSERYGQRLDAAPALAYQAPGVKGGKARPAGANSWAALVKLYHAGDFYAALARATQKDYDYHLRALDPLLGDRPVQSLTRGPLRKLYETLTRTHGVHVANMRMRVVSAVLSYGIEIEWLGAHPMTRFRYRPRRRAYPLYRAERADRR
jgi:hypothetical protein